MHLLAIETAGPNCAVAILRNEGDGASISARIAERIGTGHAERLMAMIGEALAAAAIGYGDLGRIAVSTGPGSFTGVRIGLAAARGLALALGVPVIGVGVLEALVAEARRSEEASPDCLPVACLDARRGEVYALAGSDAEPSCTSAEALAQRLAGLQVPIGLIGSAADAVAAQPALSRCEIRILSRADAADVAIVARIGLEREAKGKPSPVYLRPPDAKPQTGKAVTRR